MAAGRPAAVACTGVRHGIERRSYRPAAAAPIIGRGGAITSDALHGYAAYGAANWIWLCDLPQLERVVEVGGTLQHALGLAAHFEQVIRVVPSGLDPEQLGQASLGGRAVVTAGSASDLPVRSASVDCLALRDPLRPDGIPGAAAAFREARRILRPGGCVSFGFHNPWWASASRLRRRSDPAVAGHSVRAIRRRLSAAGFGAIDLYYADPTFAAPATLVPRARATTGFFEQHRVTESRTRPLRRFLARAGGHALLYPGCLCIAYV